MRITFVTRKFGNVERNSHCDVLHITPIRVARLFLDGDFAIKAYSMLTEIVYCRMQIYVIFNENFLENKILGLDKNAQ